MEQNEQAQEQDSIPNGFKRLPLGRGFTDAIAPCYHKMADGGVTLGLRVEQQHCNMLGICHGGVLMTLADIAAASGVNMACGKKGGSPTINLSVDFISAGRLGQWLQADITHTTVKRRFGFCSGAINSSAGIVARFNGTFYLPDHDGMRKTEKRTEGILGAP